MKLVTDPTIAVKINRMQQRVRWRERTIVDRGIDQTRLVVEDDRGDSPEFSFLVIGDSGSGAHRGHNPQRQIALQMVQHQQECRFLLHTGDVIYLVGSSDFYPPNFIAPYREFLLNGENFRQIAYDRMVFNLPFLPVPGNHDYYDLPLAYGILAFVASPLRRLLQAHLDLDIGFRGSSQGKAYANAFMDVLKNLDGDVLQQHLDRHYVAKTSTGRCLRYKPGSFTRIPNRYYTFRQGGIDFFALDSNTFNAPEPLPKTGEGAEHRHELERQRDELEVQKQEILETSAHLDPDNPQESERLDDLQAKLTQLDEVKIDIEKQLAARSATTTTDIEQLEWLRQRLIESWNDRTVRGRVIYFHHPPYVTEATKWHQAQTLAVRHRLRWVLDRVARDVGDRASGRSLVDLVLSGHAHCLEYLRTVDTGHADSHINWIVCGGSGHSLRRQRQEGPDLTEPFKGNEERLVAKSQLFVGRSGHGTQKRRPYSFLRIDVQDGTPPKFVIRPFVAEWYQQSWKEYAIDPFVV